MAGKLPASGIEIGERVVARKIVGRIATVLAVLSALAQAATLSIVFGLQLLGNSSNARVLGFGSGDTAVDAWRAVGSTGWTAVFTGLQVAIIVAALWATFRSDTILKRGGLCVLVAWGLFWVVGTGRVAFGHHEWRFFITAAIAAIATVVMTCERWGKAGAPGRIAHLRV